MGHTWRKERTEKQPRRPQREEHSFSDTEGDYRNAYGVEDDGLPPVQRMKHGHDTHKGKRK